jgi:hypothetical protein
MSAYAVFTRIRTRDWIIDHSTSVNSWRRRVVKGSFGSLVNHMRPDPGRPFISLPPFNPGERLAHVPAFAFAAHGSGDFCRAHPFFTQGDDAGSAEGDESAHDCDENRKAGSDSRHAHRPTDGVLPVRLAYEP